MSPLHRFVVALVGAVLCKVEAHPTTLARELLLQEATEPETPETPENMPF